MAVMDEDLQRLWHLLAELSSQLTQNRDQCEQLKKQAEDLKTQAVHTGTGYALKRFNVDLSKEQFESEVERMNAQLVVENQTLQHENRQLTILLKDYETTLEQIMTRFRTHAHSTQQHELDLTKYYESVLYSLLEKQQRSASGMPSYMSPQESQFSISVLDPNVFQAIQNISILIQRAIRDLSGEEPFVDEGEQFSDPTHDPEQLAELSPLAGGPSEVAFNEAEITIAGASGASETHPPTPDFKNPFNASKSAGSDPSSSLWPSANRGDPHPRRSSTSIIDYQPRLQDPSRGGFVGKRTGSLSDAALQAAIEMERLKKENEHLRELLGIAHDINLQPSQMGSSHSSRDPHAVKLNSVVEDVIKEEEEEEEEEDEEEEEEEDVEDLAISQGKGIQETHERQSWPEPQPEPSNSSQWTDDDEPPALASSSRKPEQYDSSQSPVLEEPLTELSSLSLSDAITPEIAYKPIDAEEPILEAPEKTLQDSENPIPPIMIVPLATPDQDRSEEEPVIDLTKSNSITETTKI